MEAGRWPDFFIVGAPKCGTTSLYHYLRQHPEIFMPEHKEPYYFGRDIIPRRPELFIRDTEAYLDLFASARHGTKRGEASTWYLRSATAAEEIHARVPHAKIIIMLRDPIEQMRSMHQFQFYLGVEDIADFRKAIEAETDRRRGIRVPANVGWDGQVQYREWARYTAQVKRFIDTFGSERVFVIEFEEFRQNTREVYRQVSRFVGVSEKWDMEFVVRNPTQRVRSQIVERLLSNPPGIARFAARAVLGPEARRRIGERLVMANRVKARRPVLDGEMHARLVEEFRPEVDALEKLLRRRFPHWLRKR